MTISHNISSTTRKPGRYIEFNISAAQRGLTPLDQRLMLVGPKSAAGEMAALTPTQVFSEADADRLCGTGSELALMAKWGLKGARAYAALAGSGPQIWVCGIADPAGTATAWTLTAAGTATEAGEVIFRVGGRTMRANVANGDAATVVAAAMEAVLDENVAVLPMTASVLAAVVTLSAVSTGINGQDVPVEIVSAPAGITVTPANSVPGAGVVDITAALDVLLDRDYLFIATSNHTTGTITDYAAHLVDAWAAGTKKFRFCIQAERGTLSAATTLSAAADDYKQLTISAEGFRNPPGEIAAYVGAFFAGENDPALHFNDIELPDLYLPDGANLPTDAEIETAIAGGVTILGANKAQTKAKIVRAVTSKITEASVPFFAMLDLTIPRSMAYVATQIDIALALAFPRAKNTARTEKAIRSVGYRVLKLAEELEIVQNVDAHAAELVCEQDAVVPSRAVLAVPTSVVPPLNQIVPVMNLLVE